MTLCSPPSPPSLPLLVLCALCSLQSPLLAIEFNEAHTDHYDVFVEGGDANDYGKLLEQEYAVLKDFFQQEPHQRLRVKICKNRKDLLTIREQDGVRYVGSMNVLNRYVFSNKTAYILAGAMEEVGHWSMIHEAVHQFQFLACADNKPPRSLYYAEGIAEHFAHHHFQNGRLELGILPSIVPLNLTDLAAADFQEKRHGHFRALVADEDRFDPGDLQSFGAAWGLVEFLIKEHPKQFAIWAERLDHGAGPAEAWDEASKGLSDDDLSHEYVNWLQKNQGNWAEISTAWVLADSKIKGASGSNLTSLLVLRKPVNEFHVMMHRQSAEAQPGIIFDHRTDEDFQVVTVMTDGSIHLWVRAGNGWSSDRVVGRLPESLGPEVKFDFKYVETSATVSVNEVALDPMDVRDKSRVGLAVTNGVVTCDEPVTEKPATEK